MEAEQPQSVVVRRAPAVLAVLAAAATALAFLHISVWGAALPPESERYFNGWPVPFGAYSPPLQDQEAPEIWRREPFRLTSARAAVSDLFLAVALIAATAVTIYRLVRRVLASLQFTIAEMLALTTAVAMVLGIARLDDRVQEVPDLYTPVCALHPFDQVTVLFAIGCAVAFVFSSVIARLGTAGGETLEKHSTAEDEETNGG
jgi:hypothetical protein